MIKSKLIIFVALLFLLPSTMVFAPVESAPQQRTSWWQSFKTSVSNWWNRKQQQPYWQIDAAKQNQQRARQGARAATVEAFSNQPFSHPVAGLMKQRKASQQAMIAEGAVILPETRAVNVALQVPLGIENAVHALLALMFQKPSENDQAIEKEIYDWLVHYVVDSDDYYPTFSSKLHALLKETDFFAFLEASEGNRWRLFQGQRNKVIAELRIARDEKRLKGNAIQAEKNIKIRMEENRAKVEKLEAEGIKNIEANKKLLKLAEEYAVLGEQLETIRNKILAKKEQETEEDQLIDWYLQEYRKLFMTMREKTIPETLIGQLQSLDDIQPSKARQLEISKEVTSKAGRLEILRKVIQTTDDLEKTAYNDARKSLENVINLQKSLYRELDEEQKAKVDAIWRQANEYAAEEAEASEYVKARKDMLTGEKNQRRAAAKQKIKNRAETIEQEKTREEEARNNRWINSLGG